MQGPHEWYLALAEGGWGYKKTVAGLTCMAAKLCGSHRTELQNSAFFGLGHCSLILLDDISQDTNFLKGDFLIRSVDIVVFSWPISGVLVLWAEESKRWRELPWLLEQLGSGRAWESPGKEHLAQVTCPQRLV